MYTYMPRPTIRCSKCDSTDICIPERDANGPMMVDHSTLLRCRKCGHEKRSEPYPPLSMEGTSLGSVWPKEEKF